MRHIKERKNSDVQALFFSLGPLFLPQPPCLSTSGGHRLFLINSLLSSQWKTLANRFLRFKEFMAKRKTIQIARLHCSQLIRKSSILLASPLRFYSIEIRHGQRVLMISPFISLLYKNHIKRSNFNWNHLNIRVNVCDIYVDCIDWFFILLTWLNPINK